MEFRPTGKHLAQATTLGVAASFLLLYLGTTKPEQYFYAGMYNSHDAEQFNARTEELRQDEEWLAHHPYARLNTIAYTEECSLCHVPGEAWSEVSNPTCDTAGCHPSIQGGESSYATSYNPVGAKYHEFVADMKCSACHTIHVFRPEERAWYGAGFNHAVLVPGWNGRFDCAACHEPFDEAADVLWVLETVEGRRDIPEAQLRREAAAWLTSAARRRLELEAAGLVDDGARVDPEWTNYSLEAREAASAAGQTALLYFRSEKDLAAGGASQYIENYLVNTGMFNEARAGMPLLLVTLERQPDVWKEFGVERPGTFVKLAPGGATAKLERFFDPRQVIEFLKSPVGPSEP